MDARLEYSASNTAKKTPMVDITNQVTTAPQRDIKELEAVKRGLLLAEAKLSEAVMRQERADEVLISKDKFILKVMTQLREAGVSLPGLA